VAPPLWGAGHLQGSGSLWPAASGLPPLSPADVRYLLVYEGLLSEEVVRGGPVQRAEGVVGWEQPQVTKARGRVERSVVVGIMEYLLQRNLRASDIPADRRWSAFRLQRAFAWEIAQASCERLARQLARKWLQMPQAA
jgi:hypothetical protein